MARILIVDDEKSIRRTLGEFLRDDGHEVIEAEDADVALQQLNERAFDVVVTDIILPRVNGVELLRRIQAAASHVQVVMMTGEPTVETASESLRAGAADYLFKPITKAAILRVVANAVKLKTLDDTKRRLEAENRAHQENLERLVEERTRRLRESEERFQQVAEHLGEWVWEVDADGLFTYASPVVEKTLGYRPHELVGNRHYYDLFPSDQREALKQDALAHFNSRLPFVRFQNYCVHRDGHLVLMETSGTPLLDSQGGLLGYRGVDSDITEQKKLEAQFLRAQRLEGIGALASGIAHDLNNILSPVLMIAPLLRDTVPDADSRAMLDTIEGCAQRGAAIIKQLLTFARGTPGARVSLPAGYLLRDMDKIIRETFPRDIHPRMVTSEDLWPLLGDVTQVHQALMNLCVNARDAMPEGGTLTMGAKNVTVDAAFAAMSLGAKPGSYVCVSVADTGTGIPPEDLDRIFDPFFTTKEIGKGTGLGLSTVLGIVRGHEGFVRVDSRLGQGTTFELYFPAAPKAEAASEPGREALPPSGQGELILLVDDEAAVCDSLRRTLETHGYRVVTAAQGAEGFLAFSQHRAEVRAVLTDMMMPVMNGPTMINALRALDSNLLILGMSGLPERKGVKGFDRVKLSALLTKPFSGDELLRVLHATLQSSGVEGSQPV